MQGDEEREGLHVQAEKEVEAAEEEVHICQDKSAVQRDERTTHLSLTVIQGLLLSKRFVSFTNLRGSVLRKPTFI